ncbi:MAG: trigger factor [Planctomycetes bacterium]|nr:trigger factor [Planctomycetota bacterium]
MQVTVERTGPCEAKVSFTVPREVFDREYRAALKASGKNVKMKGFRAGKVPEQILEREFGAQVRQKAVEHFLNQAYQKAVQENELKPVGHERIALDAIDLAEGADLAHSFEISLAPDFEIADYKGLEVTTELEPVSDEEIAEAVADLRLQRSTPEEAGEAGIPEDGLALCKVVWAVDGETLLERDGVRLAPLAPPPGVDAKAFQEALQGKHAGDAFELELTVPADFHEEERRGQTGTCTVTVSEAYAMTPPSDEELWKLLGVESRGEFESTARERLEQAKQFQENARQETVLLEGLIDKHDFALPTRMVEQQLDVRKQVLRQELGQAGVPEDQHDAQVEERAEELAAATEKAVRALFLVNRIAAAEELKVENEDLQREVQAIAQRHGARVEEVIEYYRKNNLFQQMQIELLERKVRVFLRENAKIVEP